MSYSLTVTVGIVVRSAGAVVGTGVVSAEVWPEDAGEVAGAAGVAPAGAVVGVPEAAGAVVFCAAVVVPGTGAAVPATAVAAAEGSAVSAAG